jgi:hypothetical protein
MNPTASDLPKALLGRSGGQVSIPSEGGRVFDLSYVLQNTAIRVPRRLITHWGLQEWDREGIAVWVNLDATGATIMDPASNRRLTTPHLAIDSIPVELAATMVELDTLKWLSLGLDDYDVVAPKMDAIARAKTWIRAMYEDSTRMRAPWHEPDVGVDEDGDIMFEWWNREKALTVYLSENGARYIKGWGIDVETDMEDGEASTSEIRRALWTWLLD